MHKQIDIIALKQLLKNHSITLVGIMGVGKSTIGSTLANYLQLPFYDSDREIEKSSSLSINDLFSQYGENEFRALEKRVIERILKETPIILATGGGAFINSETRNIIKKNSITIWLKADINILLTRLQRRNTRPMLLGKNHRKVVQNLFAKRREFYNQADIRINCGKQDKDKVTFTVLNALQNYLNQNNAII